MTPTARARRLGELARNLQYRFRAPALLDRALTHPSAVAEREPRARRTYDRLEFLGDRVLAVIVARLLYDAFPDAASGDLAPRLNQLVRRETLAEIAASLGLAGHIVMAEADLAAGGAENPAILADVLEAVLGAIYVDGGLEAAEDFVRRHWSERAAALTTPPADAKTELQEWAQALAKAPPLYRVVDSAGPSHRPVFSVEVEIEGRTPTRGLGTTKRQAEQAAAAAMLAAIGGG